MCTLKIIPPKCTPLCQPCDVYFYKRVRNVHQTSAKLFCINSRKTRYNISRRLYKNSFHYTASVVCSDFRKYVTICIKINRWFASKLTDEREVFLNVNEACFPLDVLKNPCNCKKVAFIRCIRCRINYFQCFCDLYHPAECTVSSASNE